jgi:cytochrome c biogenesis protein
MFTSWLYLGTGAVLALSIVACTVNRVPQLWKRATRPPAHKTDAFFVRAPLRAEIGTAASVEESVQAVRAALRARHWRVVDNAGGDPASLYADRSRWMPFGTIVAHVSLLTILLGGFLTANTGFRDSQVAVPVGDRVSVGHGTGLSVVAKSFTDAYYADGSPRDYASDLVLYKDGKVVDTRTVRVNHPMRWGGGSLFQSFFGVAASMTVRGADGSVLYQHGVPLSWTSTDGTHSIGKFAVPGQDMTVFVVTPASGRQDPEIKAGQVQIEVYKGNQETPFDVEILDPGKPVTVSGLQVSFERTVAFTGLIIARDRGAVFVWTGCALLALGTFLVLFFPHRRLWVQVRETEQGAVVRAAAQRREALKRDTAFESGFQRIAHDLQHAVTNASTTRK